MGKAEVGNMALGEDPTVAALETRVADLLGKEAALFTPTGTMANLAAIMAWTQDQARPEVLLDADAHIMLYESAGIARIGGALTRTLTSRAGVLDPEDVAAAIRPPSEFVQPSTALVCLEQTHNQAGGRVVPLDVGDAIARAAREQGVPVHVDGARLFNAAVALDEPPERLVRDVDSVMIALTKGLSCPVGSLLVGPGELIDRAEQARALLGGALRQAGHLAACGLVALDEGFEQLARDHAHATQLAEGLAQIDGISVDPEDVETNILFMEISELGVDAAAFAHAAHGEGVAYDGGMSRHRVRAVTYRGIDGAAIDEAIRATERAVERLR